MKQTLGFPIGGSASAHPCLLSSATKAKTTTATTNENCTLLNHNTTTKNKTEWSPTMSPSTSRTGAPARSAPQAINMSPGSQKREAEVRLFTRVLECDPSPLQHPDMGPWHLGDSNWSLSASSFLGLSPSADGCDAWVAPRSLLGLPSSTNDCDAWEGPQSLLGLPSSTDDCDAWDGAQSLLGLPSSADDCDARDDTMLQTCQIEGCSSGIEKKRGGGVGVVVWGEGCAALKGFHAFLRRLRVPGGC